MSNRIGCFIRHAWTSDAAARLLSDYDRLIRLIQPVAACAGLRIATPVDFFRMLAKTIGH
jgi:hypothetical protein